MVVLYLVPMAVYEKKMSRVRFQQVARLGAHPRVHLALSGPGWPDWAEGRSVVENIAAIRAKGNETPNVVLAYQVEGLAEVPLIKVTSFNEAFDQAKVNRYVLDNRFDLVIFSHANDLPRYGHWDRAGVRRVHIPHCAEPDVYRDYGLPKDLDILVAGNLNSYYYPFRVRLSRLAVQYFRKHGYRVLIQPHPGYGLPPREGTVVGPDFAQLLNRAKVVFTCSMRFKYALAKYSEIALCRALPVADLPDERQDFFREATLNVEPWMTDRDIIHAVEEVLDDPELLARRTLAAMEMTQKTSVMPLYAVRFVEAVFERFPELL